MSISIRMSFTHYGLTIQRLYAQLLKVLQVFMKIIYNNCYLTIDIQNEIYESRKFEKKCGKKAVKLFNPLRRKVYGIVKLSL